MFSRSTSCRLLLAMQERRTNNPSLWLQCKSFSHFLSALIGINFDARPHEATNSGHGGYITWDDRVKQAEMRAKKDVNEHVEKCLKLYDESEGNDVYKDDARLIGTSQDFLINTSLKVLFGTLQQWLSFACTWLRISKNILCWEGKMDYHISSTTNDSIQYCAALPAIIFIHRMLHLLLDNFLQSSPSCAIHFCSMGSRASPDSARICVGCIWTLDETS